MSVQLMHECTGKCMSLQVNACGQSFLFFFLPTLPTQFFENWKKKRFFQFYFCISLRLMPDCTGVQLCFLFCLFYCSQVDLISPSDSIWLGFANFIGKIKIKFIQTIFQLNKNRRKHDFVFPSILIQLDIGPIEILIYFLFVLRP